MNLNGEEKRIEQLFLELRSEDFTRASSFEAVLNRQSGTVWERRLSFVLSIGLALIAITILAIYAVRQRSTVRNPVVQEAVIAPQNDQKEPEINVVGPVVSPNSPKPAKRRRLRRSSDQLMLAIKSLSEWRSPTASLLDFPGEDLLKGLPKLGESLEKTRSLATDQFN